MEASKQDQLVLVGNHSVTRAGNWAARGCELLPLEAFQVQPPQITVVLEAALHAQQPSSHNAGQCRCF